MLPTVSFDRYAVAAQEDRCAPRSKVSVEAILRQSGGQKFAVRVKDLSLAGFAAEAVTSMRSGSLCWLTLPGFESLQAEVVWNDATMVGCSFAQLLNPSVLDLMLERYG